MEDNPKEDGGNLSFLKNSKELSPFHKIKSLAEIHCTAIDSPAISANKMMRAMLIP